MPHPKLYHELAPWFHLVTAPQDYEEEAAFYSDILKQSAKRPVKTVLEPGSGGGNNALHMKRHFQLTLSDISPAMLKLSQTINHDLEHIEADMRTLRLKRTFDAVFIHDALDYLLSEQDLQETIQTAKAHLNPGGILLLVPDNVRETFRELTDHGGHDGKKRSARYLEWQYDPDPDDSTYTVDYAFLLRDTDGSARAIYDRHICGLFTRATWLELLEGSGFKASTRDDPFGRGELFVGVTKR